MKTEITQSFLHETLKHSNIGILLIREKKIIDVNKRALNIFGYSRKELLTMPENGYKSLIHKNDLKTIFNLIKSFDNGIEYVSDFDIQAVHKNKEKIQLSAFAKKIDFDDGYSVLITIIDISERKYLERQLKEKNELLKMALQNSRIGLWDWDIKTNKMFNDEIYSQILGYEISEKKQDFEDWKKNIHKDDVEGVFELLYAHIEGLTPYYESFYRSKINNGGWVWILDKGRISETNLEGNPSRMIGTHQDITTSKNLEIELIEREKNLQEMTKILENSLYEKDALMREIHHRVKNNLQIISSITMIHEKSTDEEAVKTVFKEFQLRIKAMAQIHETLYRSEDLENVDVSNYIHNLIDNLVLSYELDTKRIKLVLEIANIQMNLSKAMHLGLIINELVSNAFKYAFPNNSTGQININLIDFDDETIELYVFDDGIGIPKDFDLANPRSMGMKIVKISTKQLKGKMVLTKKDGTCWKIIFKKKNLK